LRVASVPPDADHSAEPPPPHASADDRSDDDAKLGEALARRGVPAEEIRRLLSPETAKPSTRGRPKRVPPSAPTLPDSAPFVPKPTVSLPPSREVSDTDRTEADRLLTKANVARRRGSYQEAEAACRSAIEKTPDDPAALEMYADILQSVGKVDDAVITYHRAIEIDPSRRSAERKYGALLLQQDRGVAVLRTESIPRNPYIAVLLSAICPGAGQLYCGSAAKGLILVLLALVLAVLLFWTPLGAPSEAGGLTSARAVLLGSLTAVYLAGLVDANVGARSSGRPRTGWEV
jgi:tetratricopeptide (TPR) repeat protein